MVGSNNLCLAYSTEKLKNIEKREQKLTEMIKTTYDYDL